MKAIVEVNIGSHKTYLSEPVSDDSSIPIKCCWTQENAHVFNNEPELRKSLGYIKDSKAVMIKEEDE